MAIMRWSDNSAIETDPRREDRLYYYLKGGHWKDAIGFAVLPLGEEARASNVTISLWERYRERAVALGPRDQTEMVVRVVEGLTKRFPKWNEIVLRAGLAAVVESAIANALTGMGWRVNTGKGPEHEMHLIRSNTS